MDNFMTIRTSTKLLELIIDGYNIVPVYLPKAYLFRTDVYYYGKKIPEIKRFAHSYDEALELGIEELKKIIKK